MGVSTNVYTVYGVQVEWDDDLFEALDDLYDDPNCPFNICDGMGGEYIVLGVLLYDSGDFRWGEMNYSKSIDISTLETIRQSYIDNFKKMIPWKSHLIEVPWKLECFVHYS